MKFKSWYTALLILLMGCSKPDVEPADRIREFYIVNQDELVISLESKKDIVIELEKGTDTYYFLLNDKEEFLQYFYESPNHIVIFKGNFYSIKQYK